MSTKQDAMRKRLLSAGLTPDAISSYLDTFRAFLAARLTKVRFEQEMLKILPRDKIHVHNEIIQDILFAAQQKKPGLPDLPIVTPIKDKRPSTVRKERPISNKSLSATKLEARLATKAHKRPHDEIDAGHPRSALEDHNPVPAPKKLKRTTSKIKSTDGSDRPKPPKPSKHVSKTSPKVRPREPTPSLPPPSPSPSSSTGLLRRALDTVSHDIPTYDGLPYFPVRPGGTGDVDLFVKLKQRMTEIALGQMGMAGVKDDAVALMASAVEQHVKQLLRQAAKARLRRDGTRPKRNLQCGPVRPRDVRQAALRNPKLLGEERTMDLERLLMLQ